MKKINDGGEAYPITLRDWFAGQALTGFCLQATGNYEKGPCNSAMVERSYVLADLMIAQREVRDEKG